jgi:hypothetical protein
MTILHSYPDLLTLVIKDLEGRKTMGKSLLKP